MSDQQNKDFEKLLRVLETISRSFEPDHLQDRILSEITDLFRADQGSILLFDPAAESEGKTLVREGQTDSALLDHFLHEMLAGWVIEHNRLMRTPDFSEIFNNSARKASYLNLSSLISIPLKLPEKLLGILNLIRLHDKPDFTEEDARLLGILANIFAHYLNTAKVQQQLFAENRRLRKEIGEKYRFDGIIGQSKPLRNVFEILERVIPTEANVLLEGESGTGKELVAKYIHYNGSRKEQAFVAVDCGALPATLLESELYGHAKGAFTGAHQDKQGLFEIADKGTLFLDEIANMPLELQSTFLRAIQEKEFRPVGSAETKKTDVRIIAAAQNLKEKIDAGQFRQDLYYRLNVISISLPPLRERQGDIVILAEHFLKKMTERHGKNVAGFEPETLGALEAYSWPGNVRELENVIERLVILAMAGTKYLPADLLPVEMKTPVVGKPSNEQFSSDIKGQKEVFEREKLLEALNNNNWNKSAAAREMGVSEHYVRSKMKKFGIIKPD